MRRLWFIFFVFVCLITILGLRFDMVQKRKETSVILKRGDNVMQLASSVFEHNGRIPNVYTCSGRDVNPPLTISDVPQAAKSLVLIVDDPDAPGGTWVHWVVYNISPSVGQIAENSVPEDGLEGYSSFGKAEYGGPCPPPGIAHHYHFRLYALDVALVFDKADRVNKELVEQEMKDHIIVQSELIGVFSK